MMNLDQIKKFVTHGESSILEFKKSTGQMRSAFETVCAFLNGEGGIVLIGVTDEGKIIGQNVADSACQEIAHAILEIEPLAQSQIAISYVTVHDRQQVIAIKVEAGKHIPYTFDGRPFHRIQSTTSKMPQHRYEQLIVQRGQLNHAWDELVALGYKQDDLNHDLILSTIATAVNHKELPTSATKDTTFKILERFKLIKEHQILNVAVALFGKNLFPDYPQCQIKLARFKGTNKKEFLDSKHFYGNIFELLDYGEVFLKRHLPVAAKIVPGQFRRIETPIIMEGCHRG